MDALIKQSTAVRSNLDFLSNLGDILREASSEVTLKPFFNWRGRGFVLENESIWLGYLLTSKRQTAVELTFHSLPKPILSKLNQANSLKVFCYSPKDLLEESPYDVALRSFNFTQEINCEEILINHGDPNGPRINYRGDCYLGATLSAFSENAQRGEYGPNAIPWFEHATALLNQAAKKYALTQRIREYKGLLLNA